MPDHAVFLIHHTQPGRRDEVRAVWMEHMAPIVSANARHLRLGRFRRNGRDRRGEHRSDGNHVNVNAGCGDQRLYVGRV